jgi:hypothetical protein
MEKITIVYKEKILCIKDKGGGETWSWARARFRVQFRLKFGPGLSLVSGINSEIMFTL